MNLLDSYPLLFSFVSAMLFTAIVETLLLFCFRYHQKKVLLYFFILNLVSNGSVNLLYNILWQFSPGYIWVLPLEIGVYLFEGSLLGLMVGYNKKLWLSVLSTNLISFLLGVILLGL